MKKVCYFGIYDPKHWRTRIIIQGLKSGGYEVIECRVDPREVRGLKKYFELYRKYKSLKTEFDWIIVGFPGYLAVVLANMMTSSPIIFDAYISYFDGIRDRRDYPVMHPMMWIAWLVDFISGRSSNVVLTINEAYKDFFIKTLKIPRDKVEVLHKGADEKIFYPREEEHKPKILVGWWGSYIPLHGLPIIVEAAHILRDRGDIEFELIGGGQLVPQIRKQVEKYNLSNIKLTSYIPQGELAGRISEFDIVLGIFAPTPKSARCVTNKVYEAIAMGKAVITEDSPANREIFEHKETAYLVPGGNPQALADAIIELATGRELREKIGSNAYRHFKERFTAKKIEEELIDIIKRHER